MVSTLYVFPNLKLTAIMNYVAIFLFRFSYCGCRGGLEKFAVGRVSCSFDGSSVRTVAFTLAILPSLRLRRARTRTTVGCRYYYSTNRGLLGRSAGVTPGRFHIVLTSLRTIRLVGRNRLRMSRRAGRGYDDCLFAIGGLMSIFSGRVSWLALASVSFFGLLFADYQDFSTTSFLSNNVFHAPSQLGLLHDHFFSLGGALGAYCASTRSLTNMPTTVFVAMSDLDCSLTITTTE